MTPREHIGEALIHATRAGLAMQSASMARSHEQFGRYSMHAARDAGAAAGHAFRALEILYDREQAALVNTAVAVREEQHRVAGQIASTVRRWRA